MINEANKKKAISIIDEINRQEDPQPAQIDLFSPTQKLDNQTVNKFLTTLSTDQLGIIIDEISKKLTKNTKSANKNKRDLKSMRARLTQCRTGIRK